MEKELIQKTDEDGRKFTVEFANSRPLRMTHLGKHWPRTTQCVVKCDGLVIGIGNVVKHDKDKDNPKAARMYAAKKAFANANEGFMTDRLNKSPHYISKNTRNSLWKQILA